MKAILVLDNMPDRCGHCRLSAMKNYYTLCMVTGLECTISGRPDWCPLREVKSLKMEWGDTEYLEVEHE